MLFSEVFIPTEPRSANQNLRLRVPRPIVAPFLPPPSRLSHLFITSLLPYILLDRHCDEKPLTVNPLVPSSCKCRLPQPLSLHILTNAPGVWGSSLPFLKSYLSSFCSQRPFPCLKPFCKSLIFYSLRTLPSSASRNSFACHSYENCRVCTNSSQFGTPPFSTTPSPEVPLRA